MLTQIKIGVAPSSTRPPDSHVVADVIKDARAKLRPPEVVGHVDDVKPVDTLECDKANARVRRLQRRHLRRSVPIGRMRTVFLIFSVSHICDCGWRRSVVVSA